MSEPRTMIVCGGRDYADRAHVDRILTGVVRQQFIDAIVTGGATGADALAAEWAREHGMPHTAYPAQWHVHGRAAGPIRNERMLAEARPVFVVAFPGGRGTDDMVRRALAVGVPVMEVHPDSSPPTPREARETT